VGSLSAAGTPSARWSSRRASFGESVESPASTMASRSSGVDLTRGMRNAMWPS
jgi:hypothetical protein